MITAYIQPPDLGGTDPPPTSSSNLWIIGAVVGGVVVLIIIVIVLMCYLKKTGKDTDDMDVLDKEPRLANIKEHRVGDVLHCFKIN